MNGNAIKSLQGILSRHDKNDTGWIIPLKEPPQSSRYKPVLNYILVGNRYLVKEKWKLNYEISKERARKAMWKSRVRPHQAHLVLTKKLGTMSTSRRIMSPNNFWRRKIKTMRGNPQCRTFSPKLIRNENMSPA